MPDPEQTVPTNHRASDEDPNVTRCGAPWEPWQDPTAATPTPQRRYPGDPVLLCATCYAEEPTP